MALFRCGSSGGASGSQVDSGTFVTNTSADSGYKVTTGFKPKYIGVQRYVTTSGSNTFGFVYDADMSETVYARFGYNSTIQTQTVGTRSLISLISVNDDGFTVYTNSSRSTDTYSYFAGC